MNNPWSSLQQTRPLGPGPRGGPELSPNSSGSPNTVGATTAANAATTAMFAPVVAGVNQANADSAYGIQQASASQQTQMGLQNQFNQMQGLDSAYPSFPNSAGLGTQTGYSPGTSGGAPVVQNSNPWMFQGDSNAR